MRAFPFLASLRRTAAVVAILLLAACGSKLTAENFARVQPGMSQKDVVAILGNPTSTKSMSVGSLSGTMASWDDGKTLISIQFLNDKVEAKQMSADEQKPEAK